MISYIFESLKHPIMLVSPPRVSFYLLHLIEQHLPTKSCSNCTAPRAPSLILPQGFLHSFESSTTLVVLLIDFTTSIYFYICLLSLTREIHNNTDHKTISWYLQYLIAGPVVRKELYKCIYYGLVFKLGSGEQTIISLKGPCNGTYHLPNPFTLRTCWHRLFL